MDAARWKSIETLFNAAWELPEPERPGFLDRAAEEPGVDREVLEEVRRLVGTASLDRPDPLVSTWDARDAIRGAAGALARPDPRGLTERCASGHHALPERIGEFRILEPVGRGAMSVVYRAAQDRPRRIVALKLMRPGSVGENAIQRFAPEADLLARLDHPAIARVYSAGCETLDGEMRPFVAMEFIEGRELDDHVRSHALGRDAILALLAEIADGVHHAHQRGVLHRDLKPSNILVSETGGIARPHILDFGVARILDGTTGTLALGGDREPTRQGALIGTLSYLPPEAFTADADADTGRDIYALGVIAYELLADRLPFGAPGRPLAELMRSVREDDPVPLGSLRADCRGDVERVVSKAMARDRRDRYDSAAALATDLRRVLAGEPILARAPTLAEEWRRLYRRRRPAILGLATAGLGLWVGAVLAVHGLIAATGERDRARDAEVAAVAARDEAEAVQAFLVETLGQADPTRSGARAISVHAAVDRARASLGERFPDRPRVEAAVRLAIGRVALSMGAFDMAESELVCAEELAMRADGPEAPIAIAARLERGILLRERGELIESIRLLDACVAANERGASPHPPSTLDGALFARGVSLQRLGELDRALADHERALALRQERAGERSLTVADSLDAIGIVHRQAGRFAVAEQHQRQALAWRREQQPEGHPSIGDTLHNLSRTVQMLGRFDEALELVEESLAIQRAAFAAPHPSIALVLRSTAITLGLMHRFGEADARYAEAIAMYESLFPDGHSHLATALVKRAELALQGGRESEAVAWVDRAHGMLEAIHDYADRSVVRVALIQVHLLRGELSEAGALASEELEEALARFGERHLATANALTYLADVDRRRGAMADAAAAIDRAVRIEHELLGDDHPRTTQSLYNRGVLAQAAGDHDAAARCFDASARGRERRAGVAHPAAVESRLAQARSEIELGRADAALVRLRRCQESLRGGDGAAAERQRSEAAALIDRVLASRGTQAGDGE